MIHKTCQERHNEIGDVCPGSQTFWEEGCFMEWEFEILDFLQSIHSPILTKLMSFVTFLGDAGWFWIILGIFLLCMKKYRFAGIAALTALIFDFAAANLILKPLVARPRPCWINESVEMLVRVPEDYSFPSGHTMASFAAAGALLFMGQKKIGICAVLLAVLMGVSRMYFYVHFPTDVLAGAVLGLACGRVGAALVKKGQTAGNGRDYL